MQLKKGLYRNSNKGAIAGVCYGISTHWGWDLTLVRVIYALLTFCTAFSGVLIYLILVILMPDIED